MLQNYRKKKYLSTAGMISPEKQTGNDATNQCTVDEYLTQAVDCAFMTDMEIYKYTAHKACVSISLKVCT